jgi:hypothetical protein
VTENPPEHEHPQLHRRNITVLFTGDDTEISVDHLYSPETGTCGDCGGIAIAPGMIALGMSSPEAWMTAEEALLVINRLTRAVNVVLETAEDAPDPEREAVRFGPVPDSPEGL